MSRQFEGTLVLLRNHSAAHASGPLEQLSIDIDETDREVLNAFGIAGLAGWRKCAVLGLDAEESLDVTRDPTRLAQNSAE